MPNFFSLHLVGNQEYYNVVTQVQAAVLLSYQFSHYCTSRYISVSKDISLVNPQYINVGQQNGTIGYVVDKSMLKQIVSKN